MIAVMVTFMLSTKQWRSSWLAGVWMVVFPAASPGRDHRALAQTSGTFAARLIPPWTTPHNVDWEENNTSTHSRRIAVQVPPS
ncbi:hypothetical protein B0T19DRAFT_423597 [Cercophora scortea]|uniref:Uncharacterized protein n=1 Tax=Cercophora scortea TaxID=314031 RepID=A0AAE0INC1_9PEZI|nr:hypothetical protein B0T19DRAFT_423597 [Cercophora scortea]